MSLRIGIVGTGSIAGVHIASLAKVPEAEVVACVDVDFGKAAERASEIRGCTPYKDVSAMLDEQALNAAYICVPPFAHGDIELMLIERGIPFFLEKPINFLGRI